MNNAKTGRTTDLTNAWCEERVTIECEIHDFICLGMIIPRSPAEGGQSRRPRKSEALLWSYKMIFLIEIADFTLSILLSLSQSTSGAHVQLEALGPYSGQSEPD